MGRLALRLRVLAHQLDQSFLAHRKTDARPRPTALDFDQPVVAAAGANGALRAELIII